MPPKFSRNAADQKKKIVAIFVDLTKAFDTMDHSLQIEKLHTYGFFACFFAGSVKSILSYLKIKKQRTFFKNSYSFWDEIMGILQGSILGSLLLTFFFNDVFLLLKTHNIGNYADDNT